MRESESESKREREGESAAAAAADLRAENVVVLLIQEVNSDGVLAPSFQNPHVAGGDGRTCIRMGIRYKTNKRKEETNQASHYLGNVPRGERRGEVVL